MADKKRDRDSVEVQTVMGDTREALGAARSALVNYKNGSQRRVTRVSREKEA